MSLLILVIIIIIVIIDTHILIIIVMIIVITTIILIICSNLVVEAPLVYTSVVPAPSYSPVSDLVSYYKLCRLIKLSIIVMLI